MILALPSEPVIRTDTVRLSSFPVLRLPRYASSVNSQPELVRRGLNAKKHVLSEKPVAPTVTQARELIAEYEQNHQSKGLIWEVAERECAIEYHLLLLPPGPNLVPSIEFYHEPRYKRVREILESGKLGQVHFFQQTVLIHMKEGSKYHCMSQKF